MALVLGTNTGFCLTAPTTDPQAASQMSMNYKISMKYLSPAGATKLTGMGWWCDAAPENTTYDIAVYDHNAVANTPGLRLAKADNVALALNATGWKHHVIDVNVTENTSYWIVVYVVKVTTASKGDYQAGSNRYVAGAAGDLPANWNAENIDSNDALLMGYYVVYQTAGTNIKVNIGDVWKDVASMKINIGDVWKDVTKVQINIGDVWKTVFG